MQSQLSSSVEYKSQLLNNALNRGAETTVNIQKHRRLGEDIIQGILFLAGVISIFTTIGIVVVLGSESLQFFSRTADLETNRETLAEISPEDTTLRTSTSGLTLEEGDWLRVNDELMRITEVVTSGEYVVERAINGTTATAHAEGAAVFYDKPITLGEFFDFSNPTPRWSPQIGEFNILPLLNSTLMTSLIAMLVAGPLGLGAAVYLSEYAQPRVRAVLKPLLEVLAGIPTVVYGYFALTFMTPILREILGPNVVQIYNVFSAALVMGIMITPTIASLSEDALSAVPRALREASYGLGATRLETILNILLPAAISGIVAAFILGISRAVGETMIVALAAGAGPNFTFNPFEAAETMSGHIVRISTGDLSFGTIDYNSVFAIGLTLFLMTFVLNIVSSYIARRFREVY